jgi:hypothetical protein
MLVDRLKKMNFASEVFTIISPISLSTVQVTMNKQTKSLIGFVRDRFQQVEIV